MPSFVGQLLPAVMRISVFVGLTAPGDLVGARLVRVQRRWARAELVQVLEAGPARRAPRCPVYARCGGCSWMHLDEHEQSAARVEIARSALERLGGFESLPEIERIPSPSAFGYRVRARVAHANGRVGYRARASHEVVDVDCCAVLDSRTHGVLDALRASPPSGQGEIEIRGFDDDRAFHLMYLDASGKLVALVVSE